MNYLELVQMAMRESGITGEGASTTTLPTTLSGASGMTARFKKWVADAWWDIQLEQDDDEWRKTWFSTTITPRFYFDLGGAGWRQPIAGDVLTGVNSGCTFTVSQVIITNDGLFSDGTAQGFIEYSAITDIPFVRETFRISGTDSVRFVHWGDWRLSDSTEMGDAVISDLEDIWWQSLKLQSISSDSNFVNELPIAYMDYSKFIQNYDVTNVAPNRPIFVTETPDDGVRLFFYPPPDKQYSLQGYYIKNITVFDVDTDEPDILKQIYHPMIAWRAVWYYGKYEMQPAIEAMAKERYEVYKKRLERESELPVVFRPMAMY